MQNLYEFLRTSRLWKVIVIQTDGQTRPTAEVTATLPGLLVPYYYSVNFIVMTHYVAKVIDRNSELFTLKVHIHGIAHFLPIDSVHFVHGLYKVYSVSGNFDSLEYRTEKREL